MGYAVADQGEDVVVANISRRIVQIYKAVFGRGPTQAKTVCRDELVVVILGAIFGRDERALLAAGRFDLVRAKRQLVRDLLADELRQVVEEETARSVRTVLGQVAPDDVAGLVFLLD
jgi:uncharacterized protein YbcI